MSSHINLINNSNNTISITNLSWNEYRNIMLAIETATTILKKEFTDSCYLNQERERLLQKMGCLYVNLQDSHIPHKGQAISLDEEIIEKCIKNNKL